jgi:molecular chaperone GrpE
MTWRIFHYPSSSDGNGSAVDPEKDETAESITSPMDPTAQLQADLDAAKAEVAEWQDRFLRKAAELENFRKRSDKEKTDSIVLAKSSVLSEFLPIADACERALKMFDEDRSSPGSLEQYQQGVEMLYRQLLEAFNRTGTVAIEAEGKPFDPHLHEAVSREETPDFDEGTVTKELRRGYLLKEKLLRAAQVVVAVRPQAKDQAPE